MMTERHYYELAKNLQLLLIWDVNKVANFYQDGRTVPSRDGLFTVTAKNAPLDTVSVHFGDSHLLDFNIGDTPNVLSLEKVLTAFASQNAQKPIVLLANKQEDSLDKKESDRLEQAEKDFHQATSEHRSFWD